MALEKGPVFVAVAVIVIVGSTFMLVKKNQPPFNQLAVIGVSSTVQQQKQPAEKEVYIPDVTVVDLPAGERFVHIILGGASLGYNGRLYVTRNIKDDRIITLWKPGTRKGLWEPHMRLQEH